MVITRILQIYADRYYKINAFLKDSLLKNSLYLISGAITTSGLGLLSWMVIARFYSSTEMGLAASIISSLNLITLISYIGLNISIIKFYPLYAEKNNIINSCLTASTIAALITSTIFILGINMWSPEFCFLRENLIYGFFFIILVCIWTLTGLMNSLFISNRSSGYVLKKELIFGVLKIPLPIAFVSFGVFGVLFSWGICAFISLIYGYKALYKIIAGFKQSFCLERNILREMFSYSVWNYLANFFGLMPGYVLSIMIVNLISSKEAAYFYTAWSIANILFMIPRQSSQSLFAEGSNFQGRLEIYTINSLKFILLILVPAVILTLVLGDKLLLIFGSEYSQEGFELLKIFAVSSIPLTICTIYTTVKNVEAKVKTVLIINGIIALITIIGSYLFINRIGLVGVGYAWALGNTIVASAIVLLTIHSLFRLKLKNNM